MIGGAVSYHVRYGGRGQFEDVESSVLLNVHWGIATNASGPVLSTFRETWRRVLVRRRLVQSAFSPRAIKKLTDYVGELANDIIADLHDTPEYPPTSPALRPLGMGARLLVDRMTRAG